MYIYSIWQCYETNGYTHDFNEEYITHTLKFTKEEFKGHIEEAKSNTEYGTPGEVSDRMIEMYGYERLKVRLNCDLETMEVE